MYENNEGKSVIDGYPAIVEWLERVHRATRRMPDTSGKRDARKAIAPS